MTGVPPALAAILDRTADPVPDLLSRATVLVDVFAAETENDAAATELAVIVAELIRANPHATLAAREWADAVPTGALAVYRPRRQRTSAGGQR